jgi:hypothetical protein
MLVEAFKIWRNPQQCEESPKYMGEFCPPEGQICLYSSDLVALGFAVGSYTVRVPELFRELYAVPRWQRIDVR